MTDIQALKKAAEAATPGPYEWSHNCASTDEQYCIGVRAVGDYRELVYLQSYEGNQKEILAHAQLIALLDPATVLELCRLAEIGERVERAAKGDENGYLEIPKFLRRGND